MTAYGQFIDCSDAEYNGYFMMKFTALLAAIILSTSGIAYADISQKSKAELIDQLIQAIEAGETEEEKELLDQEDKAARQSLYGLNPGRRNEIDSVMDRYHACQTNIEYPADQRFFNAYFAKFSKVEIISLTKFYRNGDAEIFGALGEKIDSGEQLTAQEEDNLARLYRQYPIRKLDDFSQQSFSFYSSDRQWLDGSFNCEKRAEDAFQAAGIRTQR